MAPVRKKQATEETPAKDAKAAKKKSDESIAAQVSRIIQTKITKKPKAALNWGQLPYASTGSTMIDDLIGGVRLPNGEMKCPGYPRRQITEIFGPYSSGKTTAALQAVAECQRQGGTAMYLDHERAVDLHYAKSIGVDFDPDKLIYEKPKTLQEGFSMMFIGIKKGVDLIVIDSVAAMVPLEVLNRAIDDNAKVGAHAAALSRLLPQLLDWLHDDETAALYPKGTAILAVNQMRSEIGKMTRGEDTHTSGGKALQFYNYLKLRFMKIKTETFKTINAHTGKEVSQPFGQQTQVKVVKCKIDGKAGHTTEIFIRYNQGIDDVYSLIESGVAHKLIKKPNLSTLIYEGQSFKGRENLRKMLVSNPSLVTKLRADLLDQVHSQAKVKADDDEDEDEFSEIASIMGDDADDDGTADPVAEEVDVTGDAEAAE